MVKITEELVRKKSEHNEKIIGTLEELSLHQEDVEKIEHLQSWCRDLQILLLQGNLIEKIENLHKLKNLQYLNLALNNIEKVENLERCESLQKLDLTVNFIGDLESVQSLQSNLQLKDLYLTGNPCTQYEGYKEYVIAKLPQITHLDNIEITRSERIKAIQALPEIEKKIKLAQIKYNAEREEQKERIANAGFMMDDEDFWHSSSEYSPEVRREMSRRSRRARNKDAPLDVTEHKKVTLFNKDGRPLNVNQAKVDFTYDDSDPEVLVLDVSVYKFLDSSYLEVDLQPMYVRVTIKKKVLQFVFPEEIFVDKSTAKRSKTTGHLVLTMPRVDYKPKAKPDKNEEIDKNIFLEVQPKADMDFSRIVENSKKRYEDNPEVPPLEFG